MNTMTLMKQWDDLAQAVANDRGAAQRFWSDYYQKEKSRKMLNNKG